MCNYLPSSRVHSNCRCLGKNDLLDQGLKLTNAYKDCFNTHCQLALIRNWRDKKGWTWRDDCSQENWIYPCLRSWFVMLGGIGLFIADLTAACVAVSSLSNRLDSACWCPHFRWGQGGLCLSTESALLLNILEQKNQTWAIPTWTLKVITALTFVLLEMSKEAMLWLWISHFWCFLAEIVSFYWLQNIILCKWLMRVKRCTKASSSF